MSDGEEFRLDVIIKCAEIGSTSEAVHPKRPSNWQFINVNENYTEELLILCLDAMFSSLKNGFIDAFKAQQKASKSHAVE